MTTYYYDNNSLHSHFRKTEFDNDGDAVLWCERLHCINRHFGATKSIVYKEAEVDGVVSFVTVKEIIDARPCQLARSR